MKKILLAVTLVAGFGVGLSAEILEQVLVKINGEIITKTEFERAQIAAIREMPDPPDLSRLTDAELSKTLAQVTPRVIVSVIDEMLLLQRAKELGLSMTDAQFNEVLASIKKDNKIETEEAFEAALKSEGLTLAQLKEMLRKRMLIGQVQRRDIGGRVEVTEAEERAYYDAHVVGVRDDAQRHAARDRRQGRGRSGQEGGERRRARRGAREGRGDPRASHQGRVVREAGGGDVGRAIQGQRRPHRTDLAGRDERSAAANDLEDEGRRDARRS